MEIVAEVEAVADVVERSGGQIRQCNYTYHAPHIESAPIIIAMPRQNLHRGAQISSSEPSTSSKSRVLDEILVRKRLDNAQAALSSRWTRDIVSNGRRRLPVSLLPAWRRFICVAC
jgi:hypothetical protein